MKTNLDDDIKSNQTLKTIFERRAVRQYRGEMIEESLLNKIIDAGRMAPSAMNRQPWKFYVLTHQDTIDSFSKAIIKYATGQGKNPEISWVNFCSAHA